MSPRQNPWVELEISCKSCGMINICFGFCRYLVSINYNGQKLATFTTYFTHNVSSR